MQTTALLISAVSTSLCFWWYFAKLMAIGYRAFVGLLPQTQPLDRDRAGIRANNRFPANYEARLKIVVGVYNTLLKRSALVVDRPFPLKDGVPLALNHPKEIFREGVTFSYARSWDFGREFLRKQPGGPATEMRIGPDTVEELFQSLYSKLRADAAAEAQNC
jgi:hypothetical protein